MSIFIKRAAVLLSNTKQHHHSESKTLYSSDSEIIGKKVEVRLNTERLDINVLGNFKKIGDFLVEPIDVAKHSGNDKSQMEIAPEHFRNQVRMNILNQDVWNWHGTLRDYIVFPKSIADANEIKTTSTVALLSDPFQNIPDLSAIADVFRGFS